MLQSLTDVGVIPTLTNLTSLNLSFNSLTTLKGLAGLSNLNQLNVMHNKLTSLAPLSSFVGLTSLNAAHNAITSLRPVTVCTALADLRVHNNKVSKTEDLMSLTALSQLQRFSLRPNPVCSKLEAEAQYLGATAELLPTVTMLDSSDLTSGRPTAGDLTWASIAEQEASGKSPAPLTDRDGGGAAASLASTAGGSAPEISSFSSIMQGLADDPLLSSRSKSVAAAKTGRSPTKVKAAGSPVKISPVSTAPPEAKRSIKKSSKPSSVDGDGSRPQTSSSSASGGSFDSPSLSFASVMAALPDFSSTSKGVSAPGSKKPSGGGSKGIVKRAALAELVHEVKHRQWPHGSAVTIRADGTASAQYPNGGVAVAVDVDDADSAPGGTFKLFATYCSSGMAAANFDAGSGYVQWTKGNLLAAVRDQDLVMYDKKGVVAKRHKMGMEAEPEPVVMQLDSALKLEFNLATKKPTLHFTSDGIAQTFIPGEGDSFALTCALHEHGRRAPHAQAVFLPSI